MLDSWRKLKKIKKINVICGLRLDMLMHIYINKSRTVKKKCIKTYLPSKSQKEEN